MTEYRSVFLDTAPFIYLLDNDPNYNRITIRILNDFLQAKIQLVTSVITIEEYLILPYRTSNSEKEKLFFSLINDCNIEVHLIDDITAMKAARIRSEYKHFKAMDSLQLASACISCCDCFLTNDKQLLQFGEIRCIAVDGYDGLSQIIR